MRVHKIDGRKVPELAAMAERLLTQGAHDHLYEFAEIFTVQVVRSGFSVPWTYRVQLRPDHVVQGGDLLGGLQRVVGSGYETAGHHPQVLGVCTQIHGHGHRVVGYFEALDLQMVLRVSEGVVTVGIGETRVLGDLFQHALVQRIILACHTRLQFLTAADGAVHE